MSRASLTVVLALGLSSMAAPATQAQVLKKLKKTVKHAAESETMGQVDRMVRDRVRCVFDDPVCIRKAKDEGKQVALTDDAGKVLTNDKGEPIDDPADAAASADAPGSGVWANYDFVPGDRVLFTDDFTSDEVGDFPRRMELVRGNWDVVEWQGRRLLRHTGPRGGAVAIHLPETLPERFTIELEVRYTHNGQYLGIAATRPKNNIGALEGNWIQVGNNGTGVHKGRKATVEALNRLGPVLNGAGLTPVRIMADGRYMKVYVNERRVANVPNAQFARSDWIYLEDTYWATEDNPMFIGDVRIAAGGRDLYDALAADGRVATHGILFATNSARIRPESTPTLEQIGAMLKDHPELRLSIEGHTDAQGETSYNLDLSKRRADAVRDFLVDKLGVDAGRLETAGYGEDRPVADNTTPEGRQQNRRVELVKLGG